MCTALDNGKENGPQVLAGGGVKRLLADSCSKEEGAHANHCCADVRQLWQRDAAWSNQRCKRAATLANAKPVLTSTCCHAQLRAAAWHDTYRTAQRHSTA